MLIIILRQLQLIKKKSNLPLLFLNFFSLRIYFRMLLAGFCCLFANIKNVTAQKNTIDYERLLVDGKLEITIAQGFTEEAQQRAGEAMQPLYLYNLADLKKYCTENAFTFIGQQGGCVQLYEKKQVIRYKNSRQEMSEQEVLVQLRIIKPNGAESLAAFEEAFLHSEVLIYQGHGRRGLGPDFDAIKIADGNFLISLNSTLHAKGLAQAPGDRSYPKVSIKNNFLDKLNSEKKWSDEIKYRIWFFNACNTRFYLDELRSDLIPKNVRENADYLLTSDLVSLYTGAATSLVFLDDLLQNAPLEDLPNKLYKTQQQTLLKSDIYDPKIIATYRPCYFWNFYKNNAFVTKKSTPSKKNKK